MMAGLEEGLAVRSNVIEEILAELRLAHRRIPVLARSLRKQLDLKLASAEQIRRAIRKRPSRRIGKVSFVTYC
jgi:hypothetical protein